MMLLFSSIAIAIVCASALYSIDGIRSIVDSWTSSIWRFGRDNVPGDPFLCRVLPLPYCCYLRNLESRGRGGINKSKRGLDQDSGLMVAFVFLVASFALALAEREMQDDRIVSHASFWPGVLVSSFAPSQLGRRSSQAHSLLSWNSLLWTSTSLSLSRGRLDLQLQVGCVCMVCSIRLIDKHSLFDWATTVTSLSGRTGQAAWFTHSRTQEVSTEASLW